MHQLKKVDMMSVKMDLLIKKLEDRANEKQEVKHIHDSRMTCEECGNTGHLENNYPETHEDVNFVNNYYFCPQ
jgi:transposase-like protein